MKTKLLIIILIAGLLTACGTQPTEPPASPPTEKPAPATQPTASDTAVPPTELPTQEPATATAEPAVSATVSFAKDIMPILKSRCLNCHGGDRLEEGLSFKSYAELMAGSDNGFVVIPGNADGSLMVEMVVSQEMPKRGPKLTPPQVQLIITWINEGALDN
jgi:mono/diheme cytochrome c family protein